jgi:hypothetical protein
MSTVPAPTSPASVEPFDAVPPIRASFLAHFTELRALKDSILLSKSSADRKAAIENATAILVSHALSLCNLAPLFLIPSLSLAPFFLEDVDRMQLAPTEDWQLDGFPDLITWVIELEQLKTTHQLSRLTVALWEASLKIAALIAANAPDDSGGSEFGERDEETDAGPSRDKGKEKEVEEPLRDATELETAEHSSAPRTTDKDGIRRLQEQGKIQYASPVSLYRAPLFFFR